MTTFDKNLKSLLTFSKQEEENLKRFHKIREEFGGAFMLSQYDEASKILKEIKNLAPNSFQVIEKELILLYYKEGYKKAKNKLDNILENTESPEKKFIIQIFWERITQQTSANRFSKVTIAKIESNPTLDAKKVQIRMLVDSNYFRIERSDFEALYQKMSDESYVDRYLLVLKLIRLGIVGEVFFDREKSTIHTEFSKLQKNVCDPHLKVLSFFIEATSKSIPINHNLEVSPLLPKYEKYIKGDFSQCAKIDEYSQENLLSTSAFVLSAKSIIHGDLPPTNHKEEANSIAISIRDILVDLFSEENEPKTTSERLSSIGLSLGENLIALSLLYIAKKYSGATTSPQEAYYIALLQRRIDPAYLDLIQSSNLKSAILKTLKTNVTASVFIDFLDAKYKRKLRASSFNSDLVLTLIYEIASSNEVTYKNGGKNLFSCIGIKGINDVTNLNDKRWERKILENLLFSELSNKNRDLNFILSVMELGVDRYRNFLIQENPISVIRQIKDDFPEVYKFPQFVIIETSFNDNSQKRCLTITRFLKANGCDFLYDYLEKPFAIPTKYKWKIFGELLKVHLIHYFYLGGGKDHQKKSYDIRAGLCMDLLNEFPEKRRTLFAELIWLDKNERIRLGIEQIETTKFRMLTQPIIAELKAVYSRELEMIALLSDYFGSDPCILNLLKIVISGCIQRFLWHKQYGLENILSRRIRHGFLVNAIREPLEKESILLQFRQSQESYTRPDVKKILEICHLSESDQEEILEGCSALSQKIDNSIESFINEELRIDLVFEQGETPVNSKAIFEFKNIAQAIEIEVVKKVNSKNGLSNYDLVNEIFNLLSIHTNQLIFAVKKHFNDIVVPDLNNYLESFESKVSNQSIARQTRNNMLARVSRARDGLNNSVMIIDKWFSPPLNHQAIPLTFGDAILCASKITKLKKENLDISIAEDLENFTFPFEERAVNILDIFSIIFENATKYAHNLDSICL